MRQKALALWLAVAMVAVFATDAGAATKSKTKTRLKAFADCKSLVSFARAGALRTDGGVGVTGRAIASPPDIITTPPFIAPRQDASGAPVPTMAPQAAAGEGASDVAAAEPDFSGTNVQEQGVDEPDIVKTDGSRIFAVTDRKLRVVVINKATGAAELKGTLALEGINHRLLQRGNRVLVIASVGSADFPMPVEPRPMPIAPALPQTIVTEVDVTDSANPKVARTMTVDGRFVDARQNGASARLVVEASPKPIVTSDAVPVETAVRHANVGKFLGGTVLKSNISGRTFRRNLAPCDQVRRPEQFSGLDVVAILTVDLDRGMYSLDRDGVMAGAQVVYGSADSLYVASRRYVRSLELGTDVPDAPTTEIHRFDISDPAHTTYEASGTVPGFILNSYAMSEYKGDLRVASTEQPPWLPDGSGGSQKSTVTVLRQDGKKLAPIGSVTGLGVNERIYAVRFMGDKGFVVTFRQTDPLFALDLSDPKAPTVRGELQLPGYSAYLHPITDDLLMGVGRNGSSLQTSLFDVSNLAAPTRVSQLEFGFGNSAVENEPHAFLYWPASHLVVLPLSTYSAQGFGPEGVRQVSSAFNGAVGLRAAAGQPLSEVGRITHHSDARQDDAEIERSLVAGGRIYTLSYLGLASSSLDTLGPIGFTTF